MLLAFTDRYRRLASLGETSRTDTQPYHIYANWTDADVLTEVTNGHGLQSKFVYKPLTDSTVCTKGQWPNQHSIPVAGAKAIQDVIPTMRVVAKVHVVNGQAK